MVLSSFSPRRSVPNISTAKSSPVTNSFSRGINTFEPNDAIDANELTLAQDARFDRMGEYKTRKGFNQLGVPIGKKEIYNNFTEDLHPMTLLSEFEELGIDYRVVCGSHPKEVLYSIVLKISADYNDKYGMLEVNIKSTRESDRPMATACIDPDKINSESKDIEVVFTQAPELLNDYFWVEIRQRDGGKRKYRLGTNNGNLMCKVNTATAGKITSIFEANLSNTKNTKTDKSVIFTFAKDGDETGKEELYRLKDDNTAEKLATIKTNGNPVRYSQEASVVRCVFGNKPYTLNPTDLTGEIGWKVQEIKTVDLATDTDLEIKVSNIINGTQDNLLYFDKNTSTQAVWTYPYGFIHKDKVINSFDKFDRDFRQNFPSINTGDPLTAVFNLGGTIFVLTNRHKYQIVFDTVESWSQHACAADGGTFSQESVVSGTDYAYFANEDGVFRFDGYNEISITKNKIQNVYDKIKLKESIKLEIYKNRLYVLYRDKEYEPAKALVYNLKLGIWESFDTNLYVSAMFARKSHSRRFLCGHSRMGMLMVAESDDNKHDDLGAPIQFELRTAYLHYGTPSQFKHITKWRPEFSATDRDYSVSCGYALDLSDDVKYAFSVNLKSGLTWRADKVWKELDKVWPERPFEHKLAVNTKVHGKFRRCQLRYQHYSAFEPVVFRSHTITVQTQRIR